MDEEKKKKLRAMKKKKRKQKIEAMKERRRKKKDDGEGGDDTEEALEEEVEAAEVTDAKKERKAPAQSEGGEEARPEMKVEAEAGPVSKTADVSAEGEKKKEEEAEPKASKITPPTKGSETSPGDYLDKAGDYGSQALTYLKGMDIKKARIVFIAGVVIVLLIAFIQNSKQRTLSALRSEKASLSVAYDKPIPPTPPMPPLKPQPSWYEKGAESESYKEDKKFYKEELKSYKERKGEYEKSIYSWKKSMAKWEYNTKKLKNEELPQLNWEIEVQRASLNSWAYFYYLVTMVGLVLMGFACSIFLLVGSNVEKAASIFILGFVLLQLV